MESSPLLLQYCTRVIFQESFNILHINTVMDLSLVSRDIHTTIIKPYIEANYWFCLSDEAKQRSPSRYQPKRVRGIISLSQVTISENEIDDANKQNFLNNITHLEFDYYFDTPIENHLLPLNISHLYFGRYYNRQVDNLLPLNLKFLQFGGFFQQKVDHLPHNLKELRFGTAFCTFVDHLPPTLEILQFGDFFDCLVDHLPHNLQILHFGAFFQQSIDHLPPSLKILHLGWQYNTPFNTLPIHLEKISFSHCFNQYISSLPPKVVRVEFQGDPPQFNHPIHHLNPNIKFYTVCNRITKPYQYNPK